MKQGWEIKKLGEVAIFVNGDRGKNYPSQHDFVDDGVPFINAGHLVGGSIDFASMNYISEEKYNQLGAGKIVNGDILFCLRGSLGKRAIVKDVNYGAIASSLVIIRSKNVLLNRYLFHYLGSQTVQNLITKNDNGSSQPNLSAKSVSDFSIPIPSREEQERIVEELDCLSGVIEKKQEQLRELDALAQSIFYTMFGDPITNEKGWEVKKLLDTVSIDCPISYGIVQPMDDVEGGIPIVRPIDLVDTFVRKDYLKRTSVDISNAYKRTILRGDEILMCVRGTTGVVSMASDELKGCNTTRGIVPLFFDNINRWFVYYLIKQPSMQCLIAENTFGIALKQINIKELRLLPIITPPLTLQLKFADKIKAIEKQKELIKQSITQTEELFNARMDYYFN